MHKRAMTHDALGRFPVCAVDAPTLKCVIRPPRYDNDTGAYWFPGCCSDTRIRDEMGTWLNKRFHDTPDSHDVTNGLFIPIC